ncbi:MAG: bifunctional homocysteine S-methyltransferase/methylenetetrahydrofolate reductase [bacterium]|nr:bifunctional homocysteine S-methyltransferase/methylenetetrahydrofolate reductase [bacterium]
MRNDFLASLKQGVLVCDGAMGSVLYKRGVHLGRCFDALNVEDPDMVRHVHKEYLEAGARIIQTNTFGGNAFKLGRFQMAERLDEINQRGAELAREMAGDDVFVAGSIGPLGVKLEPWGSTSREDARAAFRRQAFNLAKGGIDVFICETFSDPGELNEAIAGCRDAAPEIPVIAQMTLTQEGHTDYGAPIEDVITNIDDAGPDVIGLNCSIGPDLMLEALEKIRNVVTRPISVQPNAGLPKRMDERTFYLSSPEYFAKYGRRFAEAGASIVGGCCGTTPAHIRELGRALRAVVPATGRVVAQRVAAKTAAPEQKPLPLAEKSRLGAMLAERKIVTTVELLPPRGWDLTQVLALTGKMEGAGFGSVNIPDGPRATARMSPQAMAVRIQNSCEKIEPLLHYVCRDRNLLGMQADLLGAYSLGVRNLLLLTGDPPVKGDYPSATPVFDVDAIGLTNLVDHLNRGCDVGGRSIGKPTGFVIGVGANPTAINFELEVERFYWKVDAGAEFAITQPVFDLEPLERFFAATKDYRVPVLAGIWPLQSLRNAEFLNNEVPGVTIPESIMERMRKVAGDKTAEQAEGLAIALEMARALLPSVAGLQISAPFNRGEMPARMLAELEPDIARIDKERS